MHYYSRGLLYIPDGFFSVLIDANFTHMSNPDPYPHASLESSYRSSCADRVPFARVMTGIFRQKARCNVWSVLILPPCYFRKYECIYEEYLEPYNGAFAHHFVLICFDSFLTARPSSAHGTVLHLRFFRMSGAALRMSCTWCTGGRLSRFSYSH